MLKIKQTKLKVIIPYCKVDIWALGCVLFVLCFNRHPFEDAAKLRIINGKYQIPTADKEFTEFHDLLHQLLQTNPGDRPDINQVMYHLENMAQTKSMAFQENLRFLKSTESASVPSACNYNSFGQPINRAVSPAPSSSSQAGGWMGNASSMFKGTSSFMSTIKAASTKVSEAVQ